MGAYTTICEAKSVLDIPVGLQEWIVDERTREQIAGIEYSTVRSFTVQGYEYPNCVRIQFQDGTDRVYSFAEFVQAVKDA